MAETPTNDPGSVELDDVEPVEAPESASFPEDIIKQAKARLKLAEDAESEIRRLALEDMEFLSGKQWPDKIKAERESDSRPCLVINRLPQFVHQLTNDQRQNRPQINVHPLDTVASEETAEVIQGLIKHIAYNSKADVARDTAFESAVEGGFGYYRVVTDFASPASFDQEIYIKRIRNPMSVYFDPYSQEPDGSDANWALILDDLSPDEYRAQFPDSKLASAGEWELTGNSQPDWVKPEGARIAEYFYKVYRDITIYQLSTGETVKGEAKLAERLADAAQNNVQSQVVRSRQSKEPVIKWCKINALEILDESEWPGQFIPIIPVYGKERFINGKRILEGLPRHAKDPQRMLNYWKSAETETIALAPRTPFIGVEGQFEGREDQWRTANKRNHAYLEYKPVSIAGDPAPPPQRQAFEPAVQAITNAAQFAGQDLKDTTGIYDAGRGEQGNEVSGVAIQKRNTQVQTANFHFVDNLSRSINHEGRILVDLIPHIYDGARAARIIGDDGSHKVVMLNQKHQDDNGKDVLYDMTVGRYDVTVDTGPSFATKRQEAAASMMSFSLSVPQSAQYIADLVAANMDWPGAQAIADRLKKLLPPALQDDGKQKDIPPQVIAQIQQLTQQNHILTEHLNESTKVIEMKTIEAQSRERIENLKAKTQVEIKLAELGSQESIALLAHQIQEISQRMELLHASQPVEAPNNFDPEQADGGNYAGVGHIGGSENITGGETPGSPMEGN